jgi:hypothetical protein
MPQPWTKAEYGNNERRYFSRYFIVDICRKYISFIIIIIIIISVNFNWSMAVELST